MSELHDRITKRREAEFGTDIADIAADEYATRCEEIGDEAASIELVQSSHFGRLPPSSTGRVIGIVLAALIRDRAG